MPELAATHNQMEYTVSDVAGAIKRSVEETFGYVRVRGEISGWRGPHSSGHAYFRLKDEGAVLDAVCWKGSLAKLGFRPEEGLEIVATGKITTYPSKSNYQIVIDRMEPAGVGALMALLEKRKQMLAAEGLFDAARKRPLPFLPRTIGIVTSPTGAVIRDILHRLAERFPVRVIVWPVAVQGEGAAEQIAAAIKGLNDLAEKPDLIIVARGGGSLEDLWAFNEEVVVRAAAGSKVPLISAVGHETDTTLIDFVSDRRAPTPTAAAEMAVPVRADWQVAVEEWGLRLYVGITRYIQARDEKLEALARGLPHPSTLLEHRVQRLDDWDERLQFAMFQLIDKREHRYIAACAALSPQSLQQTIHHATQSLAQWTERMANAYRRQLDMRDNKVALLANMLEGVNYQRMLERGFALVRDERGAVVSSMRNAAIGQDIALTFADGTRIATVKY